MAFMPAAWMARRARVLLEQWNSEHPNKVIAFEWVEEALLAWRAWKENTYSKPSEAGEHQRRFEEFQRLLPGELVSSIFEGPGA
jgi:hypothetical protein